MSRARKLKKFCRIWRIAYPPYVLTGYGAEQEARFHRQYDKVEAACGSGFVDSAPGVKYAVPKASYVQHKGRKQLPRLYYAKRR